MRWTAHRNDWAPDGTLGAQLGDAVENRSHEINGFESLRLSGLGTHIFALTHLVVNRAVVSSCRWLTPFEAWSLHPAMFRRIHSLGCPSSTAWLLVRLRMNVLMHISLHLRILVVIFNPCLPSSRAQQRDKHLKKEHAEKNTYTFLVSQFLFDHQKSPKNISICPGAMAALLVQRTSLRQTRQSEVAW